MIAPASRAPRIVDRVGRALRLPLRVHLTLAHTVLVFTVVELAIRRTRIERLARALGTSVDLRPTGAADERLQIDTLPLDARRQLRCAHRVAAVWPFHDGPCLRVALVGGHLVRRLDPTIRFGVRQAGTSISAHAWLEIDGKPLEDVVPYTRFELPPTGTPSATTDSDLHVQPPGSIRP